MKSNTMIVPLAYFVVSFLSSYEIVRFGANGYSFPNDWKIASIAVFSMLSMATLLFFSLKSASEFLKNRYGVKFCLSVAIILAGSCFAYIVLGYRCRDIARCVTAIVADET